MTRLDRVAQTKTFETSQQEWWLSFIPSCSETREVTTKCIVYVVAKRNDHKPSARREALTQKAGATRKERERAYEQSKRSAEEDIARRIVLCLT